ncbi:MAG: hypothetical protein KY476_16195 [Planctomycetes bacterium]|nr:hypothetical protein [Planctomycetota bacterium]
MQYRLAAMVAAVGLVWAEPSAAQDFSVYTRVYDLTRGPAGASPPLGRSLSLFHAGKVYDYVEGESHGEVIIFEPAQQRFRILGTGRALWTTVHFDEVHLKLKAALDETRMHVVRLRQNAGSQTAIEQIEFTLSPLFEVRHDAAARILSLTSPWLSYRARLEGGETGRDAAEVYLRYADWIARLNYVLHPHPLGVEARLVLNERLRELQRVPVEVELESEVGGAAMHLRAEHQFHWRLDARDRGLIHEWESFAGSRGVRHVTFAEYQRSLFAGGR